MGDSKQARSLQRLVNDIERCQICQKHLPMGANPVLRVSKSASVLIAGQAPGVRVHRSSIPFDDPSGDRLRQWMGVDKETFYDVEKIAIVPMGFCYPGTGKQGDLPPRSECRETWHPQLLPLLNQVQLILAIGAYAQQYHLANRKMKTLTETVANWQCYGPNVIPLPHPSPRNNIWLKRNPWFEVELLPYLQKRVTDLLTLD